MSAQHIPVMRAEVLEGLRVEAGKKYIDATVGGGGHAVEILKKGGTVLGIDTDPAAVLIASETLPGVKDSDWKVVQGNFAEIFDIARKVGFDKVNGILFDLGVSSMQLDTPERGFSYRFTDAPLDLRMNPDEGESAAQLVNRISLEELYDLFSRFGEEQLANELAQAVYGARSVKKFETVGDLVRIVENLENDPLRKNAVLSRVFQALRITVNHELDSLREGLQNATELLAPGGRLVVISFHSLEDRIVKLYMRQSGDLKVITKHPLVPKLAEIEENRRSRSAKVRIAEKL